MAKTYGTGSITYIKNENRYRAFLTDPTGKRISKRFRTEAEAQEWLTTTRSDMYRGEYIQPDNTTVNDWVITYVDEYCKPNIRDNTYIQYLNAVNHLAPIGNIPLQKLTAPMVQRFMNTFDGSPYIKKQCFRILKAALEKAVVLDIVKKNIMHAVVAPKLPTKEIEVFTAEEIQKILAVAEGSRYYAIILTAVTTGARLGEILGLKYCDVNNNTIYIHCTLTDVCATPVEYPTKTASSERKITISTRLEKILKFKQPGQSNVLSSAGYIFHTAKGGPLRTRNVERRWKELLEKAEVPYRKFHALRHTHATQLLNDGVPLLEVSKRLGHAKPSTTLNIYAHAIKGEDVKLPDRINRIFGL